MLAPDQKHHRELLLQTGLKPFVDELMLADPRYLIALVVLDMHGSLKEIVDEAAETLFAPGFLTLGDGADLSVEWSKTPEVVLDLVLRDAGIVCYFRLRMRHPTASIELDYIAFPDQAADPDANSAALERMLRLNQTALV